MAARADLSHPFVMLEGKYGRKNIAFSIDGEDPESPIGMNLIKVGKPPLNLSAIQPYASTARLLDSSELQDLAPGPQRFISSLDENSGFLPIFRSGSCSEIGPKPYMEDEHICIDNLVDHLKEGDNFPTGAFYGVFDGHGGMDAASFVRSNLLEFIFADQHFPISVEEAVKSAFVKADYAFADLQCVDCSSGTTALTALIFGRTMLIANAGDCRAVLGKRGRAIELSRDHKPNCNIERIRIEKLGGSVFDGYLNGQLSVSRALGDWHMKGPKGSACPLIAEPELLQTTLTEEDEFLIMGCDGLWDVMSSQCAVNMVRKELMVHNDPEKCSRALVREAIQRNTCDNLTVVVVCFSPNRPPPPPRVDISRSQFRRSISLEGLHLLQGVLDSNT